MINWTDRKYVNPKKRVFKNMETDEILNLEIQEDLQNIETESETPLNAEMLNLAQQELKQDTLDEVDEKISNLETLPTGGTTGQVLSKASDENGDATWCDIEANEVHIGNVDTAPESAKLIIEEDDVEDVEVLSKTYKGTNITANTVKGYGKIKKIYGKTALADDVNLFDFNSITSDGTAGNNNSTFVIQNGEIVVTSAGTYARRNLKITIDQSLVNKELTLSFDAVSTNGGVSNMIRLGSNNSIDTENYGSAHINAKDGRYAITFTPTSNIIYMPIYITTSHNIAGIKITVKNIKLQEGNGATSYSPYGYGTVEVISKNGDNQSSNICYIKNGLNEGDYIDYQLGKIIRADETEEDIACSNKIVQYDGQTTIYNADGAEIEVMITSDKTISEINEDIKSNEIQTITNENGTAIKFPDGTMICTGISSNGTYDGSNYTYTSTWIYPANFIDTPHVTGNVLGGNALAYTVLLGVNKEKTIVQTKCLGLNGTVQASDRSASCIAIGRWK